VRAATDVRAPLLMLAVTAWLVGVVDAVGGSGSHMAMAGEGAVPAASTVAGWLLMVATMAPLVAGPVAHLRARSLARRRGRAITLFAAGHVAAWLAACAVLTYGAGQLLRAGAPAAIGAAVLIAVAWQATPAHGWWRNRAHAHPALPAFGPAADVAALRFGVRHGLWCVGTCWALMLVPMVAAQTAAGPAAEPAAMGVVAVWVAVERLVAPTRPGWSLRSARAVVHTAWRVCSRPVDNESVVGMEGPS
jgi:predicted metal-binding membrane protein